MVHRVAGFAFVALLVIHVVRAVTRAVRARRLPVMVPTRKDFEDVVQSFRHFLLREPAPRAGKFDASEKFEYWGLFAGGLVMSVTGVILVFPELVSQVVTYGTPVVGGPKYTRSAASYGPDQVEAIEQTVAERNTIPITRPITAIHSRLDGIVDWLACIDDFSPDVRNVEVRSSHVGMGLDPDVWQIAAEALGR